MESEKALQERWRTLCDEYARAFVRRHVDSPDDFEYADYSWVAGREGEILEYCDMFIGMTELRYDVDNNVDPDMFHKWYWKNVELASLGVNWMNYEHFCMGCPDRYPEEAIEGIRKAQARVNEAKNYLEQCISDLKKNAEQ